MFGFDMLVHGERGDELSDDELAFYGIDWEALRGRPVQTSNDGSGNDVVSWAGHIGPPENLSHVELEPVVGSLTELGVEMLFEHIEHRLEQTDHEGLCARWVHALAFVQTLDPDF